MEFKIQFPWAIFIVIVLLILFVGLLVVLGGYTIGSIKFPGGGEIVLTPPSTPSLADYSFDIESTPADYSFEIESTPSSASTDPVEFFMSYWRNVSDHRYRDAWNQLSPNFQQAVHPQGVEDYIQGYAEKNYCRIEVSNIRVLQQDENLAIVAAYLDYFVGAQCNSVEYEIESRLIYEDAIKSWLYDKTLNIKRR